MKKLVSIFLALTLIFSLNIPAFAATPETYNLTISGTKDHTYKVYQIYTGDVDKIDGTLVLSNVKFGKNHYPVDGAVGNAVPSSELQDFLNSQDKANYFKNLVKGEHYALVNENGTDTSVTISVEPGYYLILDVSESLPDDQTKSPVILKVAEETTITSKHASISSTKKVDDKNDSVTYEDNADWQDAADYDIGDDVPFQLTVTLPSTLNAYDTYKLTFHDKQSDAFDAPENFKVYVQRGDATLFEVTDGYIVRNECLTSDTCEYHGCTFTVEVTDVKDIYEAKNAEFVKGDILVVEYTSRLNESANIGKTGNENSMYVCHPDGHTTIDVVTVLTYELKINKIDGESKNALTGAAFTLYKFSAEENDWVVVGEKPVGTSDFTWSGIDGGKYKLVETVTPAGYNSIADKVFVIDSTHKTEWLADGNSAFEDIIAKNEAGTEVVFADANANAEEDGKLEGNVENYKGAVLPETGAMGTMWLIFGGAMLATLAVVFMITRKKMSIYED